MSNPSITLQQLAAQGTVPPSDFSDCPERVAEIARIPLELPAMSNIVAAVQAGGLYSLEAVEEAVASLVMGNLILAGPPGTGKTQLARQLAAACNAKLEEETANPEWSVYDIVGALALPGGLRPFHDGIVTRALIDCANRVVANLDTGDPPQATWLLIDEINRAEIDRAFGPLFTALSSDEGGRYALEHRPGHVTIAVPRRFRIIATLNSYDTRFVNSMSAALRRRFARVLILPPSNDGTMSSGAELNLALDRADALTAARVGALPGHLKAALTPYETDMRQVFGAVRSLDDKGGIPVGTAQVIDCCSFLMTLMAMKGTPSGADEFMDLFDHALSSRFMTAVESDASRSRLGQGFVPAFTARFPKLKRSAARLTNFLSGVD